MAYKRTIYCRACGSAGHNRSSCPREKARIEELRANHGSDHWQVSSYDRKRMRSKERACSYCHEQDHNRVSCPTMKADMDKIRPHISAYRRAFIDALCKIGMVPGTIAVHNHGQGIRNMYLVERINFEEIDLFLPSRNPCVVRGLSVTGFDDSDDYRRRWYINDTGLLGFVLDSTSAMGYDNVQRYDDVVAAGCADSFRASVPKDWLEAKNLCKTHFSNSRQSRARNAKNGQWLIEEVESGEFSRKAENLPSNVDRFLDFSGQNPYA